METIAVLRGMSYVHVNTGFLAKTSIILSICAKKTTES